MNYILILEIKILMQKFPAARMRGQLDDFFAGHKATNGGSNDNETKD